MKKSRFTANIPDRGTGKLTIAVSYYRTRTPALAGRIVRHANDEQIDRHKSAQGEQQRRQQPQGGWRRPCASHRGRW